MQATANHYQLLQKPPARFGQFADCLTPLKNREITDWTIRQLDIQPYQQILEIGCGAGTTLQETAEKLKVGFLAGTDHSVRMYQTAYRRNKRFISRQLLQLHLGEIEDLPYPSHYFHTIYGINIDFFPKDPLQELLRLASLLKNGGRLALVFQPRRGRSETAILRAAEELQEECLEAGLTNTRLERHDIQPASYLAVIAFKD